MLCCKQVQEHGMSFTPELIGVDLYTTHTLFHWQPKSDKLVFTLKTNLVFSRNYKK